MYGYNFSSETTIFLPDTNSSPWTGSLYVSKRPNSGVTFL